MGDTNEQEAITLHVPMHNIGELEAMVRACPGLEHFSKGMDRA